MDGRIAQLLCAPYRREWNNNLFLTERYRRLTGDADEVGGPHHAPDPANQKERSGGQLKQSYPGVEHDDVGLVPVLKSHL